MSSGIIPPPTPEGATCALCFEWCPWAECYVDPDGTRWDIHQRCHDEDELAERFIRGFRAHERGEF